MRITNRFRSILIILFLLVSSFAFAQKSKGLYQTYTKKLVHDFKIFEGKNLIERGKIYRYFDDYGNFETMNIIGKEVKILYCSNQSGMVNADMINKEVYTYKKNNEKVLFLFMMRSLAKTLETGTKETKFKGITLKLNKQKNNKETDKVYTTYKVTTTPNIISGEISCLEDLMIVNVDLKINIRNARHSEFQDVFLLPEHFQFDSIRLTFSTNVSYEMMLNSNFFMHKEMQNLLNDNSFEKIEN